MRKTLLCWLLTFLLAGPLVPGLAAAHGTPWADPLLLVSGTDVTLYEATENMKLIGKVLNPGPPPVRRHRKATSELMGVARRGSPLCPVWVPGTGSCTINMTGSDNVDLLTGLGSITGTLTVVVQGDNPFDSPEFVVAKGKFKGTIDFSPALAPVDPLPFGTVDGQMVLDGGGKHKFTGTFRQPVDVGFGYPVYYTGSPLFTAVNANEFSLSYPTVRFEINFLP